MNDSMHKIDDYRPDRRGADEVINDSQNSLTLVGGSDTTPGPGLVDRRQVGQATANRDRRVGGR